MDATEGTPEKAPRQLRVHTQYLVAITSVAKAEGWGVGDPIDLDVTRSGKITIENIADPNVLAVRKAELEKARSEKEALYKAKTEKKAAEARTAKEAKEAAKSIGVKFPTETGYNPTSGKTARTRVFFMFPMQVKCFIC